MPINSKKKGSRFELQISKLLSDTFSPLQFIRTQSSGARVGGKNFETIGKLFGKDALKLFTGDIVPSNERDVLNDETFSWSIETKNYKSADTLPQLIADTSLVADWYFESVVDALKVGKKPILIFKWNNTPIFCAFSYDDAFTHNESYVDELKAHNHLVLHTKKCKTRKICIFELQDVLKYRDFWIFDINELNNQIHKAE